MIGDGFSRGFFMEVLKDSGTTGTMAKKFVDAVERGIEQDRVDMQKARAPS